MNARTISFTHSIRTGPNVLDRTDRVNTADAKSKQVRIHVDIQTRMVTVVNPLLSSPVYVPFERVVEWEPVIEEKGKEKAA